MCVVRLYLFFLDFFPITLYQKWNLGRGYLLVYFWYFIKGYFVLINRSKTWSAHVRCFFKKKGFDEEMEFYSDKNRLTGIFTIKQLLLRLVNLLINLNRNKNPVCPFLEINQNVWLFLYVCYTIAFVCRSDQWNYYHSVVC